VILTVLGLVGVLRGEVSLTQPEKSFSPLGRFTLHKDKTHNVPLDLGAVAVIGGIVLFVGGRSKEGTKNMLILLIILILLLGTGSGYYGYGRWGYGVGTGVGFRYRIVDSSYRLFTRILPLRFRSKYNRT
jgi:hypothetical protein